MNKNNNFKELKAQIKQLSNDIACNSTRIRVLSFDVNKYCEIFENDTYFSTETLSHLANIIDFKEVNNTLSQIYKAAVQTNGIIINTTYSIKNGDFDNKTKETLLKIANKAETKNNRIISKVFCISKKKDTLKHTIEGVCKTRTIKLKTEKIEGK